MCTCSHIYAKCLVITGRAPIWGNAWAFPRGTARDYAGPNHARWTAKSGSPGIPSYDTGTVDGMYGVGLVRNGPYLLESDNGTPDGRSTVSITSGRSKRTVVG
jgi:penicillin V acylase-like amidase (Ntn superfamily)